MTRVIAIFVSAYVLVAAFPAWAESPRPNIVLILADDLGFSDVAPYGSEIATPTITALAEEGVGNICRRIPSAVGHLRPRRGGGRGNTGDPVQREHAGQANDV